MLNFCAVQQSKAVAFFKFFMYGLTKTLQKVSFHFMQLYKIFRANDLFKFHWLDYFSSLIKFKVFFHDSSSLSFLFNISKSGEN